MIYLLIGEDELSKDQYIRGLKNKLFNPKLESFNYEVLSGKDLTFSVFKESIKRLPVATSSRLLVIKDAFKLKEDVQKYFLTQLDKLPEGVVIVFDVFDIGGDSLFWAEILKVAKPVSFKSDKKTDTFDLARAVERKNTEYALSILSDLLKRGEKPERILGGLRYQLVKNAPNASDKQKIVGLLLETDLRIKTGKLKPEYGLENLLVKLCL